jgi:hypothetical protein
VAKGFVRVLTTLNDNPYGEPLDELSTRPVPAERHEPKLNGKKFVRIKHEPIHPQPVIPRNENTTSTRMSVEFPLHQR